MKINTKNRIRLIRDSLIGISYHLPNPEVLLFPFLDYISLLYQAPLIFTFWEGNRCVYCSLKDPDFLSKYGLNLESRKGSHIPIKNTPYTMSVHCFPESKSSKINNNNIIFPFDSEKTSLTNELLNGTDDFSLSNNFFTSLGDSIAQRDINTNDKRINKSNIIHIDMGYTEVMQLLYPLRLKLDDIFTDSFSSSHLIINNGTLSYPNIFIVIRTSPNHSLRYNDSYNYTAGLLLLSKMKLDLEEWCASNCLDKNLNRKLKCPLNFSNVSECISALEQPLGQHSRSISDFVFSSGIVDFGRAARDNEWDTSVAGDELDEKRRIAEQCVYPSGWRLFYIPIHIGGNPWLALFTFTQKDPASDDLAWHHNYSFYRDIVHKAAALIRQEAHDVYADLIAKSLVYHLESSINQTSTILPNINQDSQKIAQVYPFPLVTFFEGNNSTNDIFIPGRGTISLNFSQNPFFHHQVLWKLGNEKSIIRHCQTAIGDFTKLEQSIQINAIAQSSHLIKVPLRVLESISSSKDSNKEISIKHQINKILHLHDAASALISTGKRKYLNESYKKRCDSLDFASILNSNYKESLNYLTNPTVSGNLASRLRLLIHKNNIVFNNNIDQKIIGNILYYPPLIIALFDGILTNAINAIDSSKPKILIYTTLNQFQSKIFIHFENSSDINLEQLSILEKNLNSPGPDMVGITNLHLISEACWPNISKKNRLFWKVDKNSSMIISKALIAEIEK